MVWVAKRKAVRARARGGRGVNKGRKGQGMVMRREEKRGGGEEVLLVWHVHHFGDVLVRMNASGIAGMGGGEGTWHHNEEGNGGDSSPRCKLIQRRGGGRGRRGRRRGGRS